MDGARTPGMYATDDDDQSAYAVTPSGRAWRLTPVGSPTVESIEVKEIAPGEIPAHAARANELLGDNAVDFGRAILEASGEEL